MVRPVVSGIVLGSLLIAGSAFGCDALFSGNKVRSQTNKPVTTLTSKRINTNSLKALEQSINEQINQYRQTRNLPPLTLDSRISEQARAHSQAMASGSVPFSHEGFDQRVKAISRSITYRGAAENVAYNQGYTNPGEQAVQGWIKSPGHQKNMVGDYDLTGIGVAKNGKGEYYFTQVFIKRR